MPKTYEEYIRPYLEREDRERVQRLEEARRSGLLGEQQRLWQEEQDRLMDSKLIQN